MQPLAVAILASCSLRVALGEMPTCAKYGRSYSDPLVDSLPSPNGAWFQDSRACQLHCSIMPLCEYFTFFKKPQKSTQPNECWLYGKSAKLVENVDGISGPRSCLTTTGTTTTPVADSAQEVSDSADRKVDSSLAQRAADPSKDALPNWFWPVLVILLVIAALVTGWACSRFNTSKKKQRKGRGIPLDAEKPSDEPTRESFVAASSTATSQVSPAATPAFPAPITARALQMQYPLAQVGTHPMGQVQYMQVPNQFPVQYR
eukprot:TRINITY_DN46131_c0_g1_i1.p1 TRINITY_DN46131_c0_g1~~TRINITY_DN46131_c0_g1_i1.p1  ORF type:complete len:267 (+),score=37.13 TRINITY_DN46131_c0_g1_i1:22-801(+)